LIRSGWCAFALGAWCLQQAPRLPGAPQAVAYLGASALLAGAAAWAARRGPAGRGRWPLHCAVLALALSAGFCWAALRAELRLAYALPLALEGRDLRVAGRVSGVPEPFSAGTRFLFKVEAVAAVAGETLPVTLDPAHFPRTVQLSWYHPAPQLAEQLQPGQAWQLTVRLRRVHGSANPGGYDTERALLERNVRASGTVREAPAPLLRTDVSMEHAAAPFAALQRRRARMRARIAQVLAGAPHGGVVLALATGVQAEISPEDRRRFAVTGTSHLVAISGLHVSLVAGLLGWCTARAWGLAARLGWLLPLRMPAPHAGALAAVLGGGAYVALAGFGVPAQRAWWMLLAAALARVSRCETGVSTVLAWALAMVVLVDPWAVAAPGFALSFGAVAALVAASSREPGRSRDRSARFSRAAAAHGQRVPHPLRRLAAAAGAHLGAALRVHWAVTLALAPLSVLWFAQIPLFSVPANLLAIPWVSFLVTPAALLSVVLPAPLDAGALHFAHGGLRWLAAYLDLLAAVPGALWRLPAPAPLPLGLALLGLLWCSMPRGWPLRHWAACLWLPLLWPGGTGPARGEFRVTVLDVGQGGAALVETRRHRLLFDTGSGPSAGDAGARVVAPYLAARGFTALDLLVLSHGDNDHAGGAPAVWRALRVAHLRASLPLAHRLWQQARQAGIDQAAPCRAGQQWQWDGVNFAFVWPAGAPDAAAPNRTACVLKVWNGAHAALLSADIEAAAEQALLARSEALEDAGALRADILLAPHHGSKTSSTPAFIAAIVPRHVVFQVGYRNRFHHPNAGVLARYGARAAQLYRSDRDGAVQFDTAANGLEVQCYRNVHRRYWMGR
jgi:competence protein ComEC